MDNKYSAAIGSGTADPVTSEAAASPVPQPVIQNKPAPGRRGPKGIAPRTSYSRTNTGVPPIPDAGATHQKSVAPRGMEFLPPKTAHAEAHMYHQERPTIQDLLHAAMEGTVDKLALNQEAAQQMANQGLEKDASDEGDSPDFVHIATEDVEKLADAGDYIAMKLAEEGVVQAVGKGPGALEVMQAQASSENIDAGQTGQATSKNQPPKDPPLQPERNQPGKANTGLATNDDMMHGEQPAEPISNEKTKLQSAKIARVQAALQSKTASPLVGAIRAAAMQKKAEDAINPAKLSSSSDTPPAASKSGEGVPSEPSDVSSQKNMIGSNQAAINFTKGQAKADPKKDVGQVLSEPPLSKATDSTLHKVLDHTSSAGVKISSAQPDTVKVAAVRALLTKYAESACKDKEKKEKQSNLGMPGGTAQGPPGNSPSSASGFNASSL